MKTLRVVVLLVAMAPVAAFADMCSEIRDSFTSEIALLTQQTQAALAVTTDPVERDAILASYNMQKAMLEMQRDMVLSSAGCPTSTDPNPTPSPTPEPTPTPTPTDPGSGGGGGGNGQTTCSEAYDQARVMAAGGASVREVHHFLHAQGCNAGQFQAGKNPKPLGWNKPR